MSLTTSMGFFSFIYIPPQSLPRRQAFVITGYVRPSRATFSSVSCRMA